MLLVSNMRLPVAMNAVVSQKWIDWSINRLIDGSMDRWIERERERERESRYMIIRCKWGDLPCAPVHQWHHPSLPLRWDFHCRICDRWLSSIHLLQNAQINWNPSKPLIGFKKIPSRMGGWFFFFWIQVELSYIWCRVYQQWDPSCLCNNLQIDRCRLRPPRSRFCASSCTAPPVSGS